jgi:hypothetical protein
MSRHELVKVTIEYVNAISGQTERLETTISVARTALPCVEHIPIQIDQHLNRWALVNSAKIRCNQHSRLSRSRSRALSLARSLSLISHTFKWDGKIRYYAATTINEAIELAQQDKFNEAQNLLFKLIEKIESSLSAREPYCLDLVKDIRECLCGMRDYESFATGMHYAQAYSEMYLLERSTGIHCHHHHTNKHTLNTHAHTLLLTHSLTSRFNPLNFHVHNSPFVCVLVTIWWMRTLRFEAFAQNTRQWASPRIWLHHTSSRTGSRTCCSSHALCCVWSGIVVV